MLRKSCNPSGVSTSVLICLFAITAIAAVSLSGCGGSSSPVSVAVTASASTVDATDAVTLTATVTNDKTPGGVTWSVSSGGTLSNETTNGATYTAPAASSSALTVTVTATSVADTTKTGTVTLTVPAAPAVTTGALAAATVGTPYSVALAASGGISPYAWTITSGTLPACLTINSAGVISGTPTKSCVGTTNLTFKVTDSGTPTALSATSAALGLTINAAPAITFTGVLTSGEYNNSYTGSVAASGGVGALTYTVSSGALPPGLGLNASTGAVTGTPTAANSLPYNVTIMAADAFGDSKTQGYSVMIFAALPTLTFATIPTETYGNAPFTVSASSASSGAITYSVVSGPATIVGNTVTLTGIGTVVLGASQAATANYTSASASTTFTVNGEAQTITFGAIATQSVNTPLTLSATASSGLAVSYASTTASVCTVSGTTATMLASGTCTIQATQAGSSTYAAATPVSQIFTVNGEAQTITFGAIATQTVGTPLTLSATASSSLPVSFSSTTASVCTVSGTTATMLTSGTCTIQAAQAGNSAYAAAAPVSQSFTVNTAAQTITFGTIATQTVGTPLTLSASASSGLSVSLASTTAGVCSVSGTIATMLTSGTCTIQATQAGNISYSPATPVSQSFTVNAAAQTITFGTIAAQNVGTPLTLSATASSGLAVSFGSTTSSVCTVSGTTATMLTTGTCTIQATQAGNTSYLAATPVSQSFTVNGLAQTITFGSIAAQTVGTPLTLSATASSTLTVSFASTTPSVCTVSGTTATMLTSGTCTIQATQPGNSTYGPATPVSQSFTVNGLAQTITFGAIATQTVGTPLTLFASASSTLAVTFASTTSSVCTVSSTTATMLTSGTCTIQATQAGNSTYAAATPVSRSFTVNAASQTITFGAIATQTVGTPLTLSATASSGLVVSFTSTTPIDCSVSGTTATMLTSGTCIIQATQPGNGSYGAATPVTQSFTVNAASQTITFNNPGSQTVGTPLTLSASSTSGLTVSFASTTTGVCTASGTTATMLTSGTCTIQATQAGNASYSAATPVSQSFQVNSAGSQVSGQIMLNNNCGNSGVPVITVNLYNGGTLVQTVTTDNTNGNGTGLGNYSFATVPNGTYAITPSITGASSVFYPATQSVTVTNGTVSGENFSASLGYKISGTITYSGANPTGQIYLYLNNNNGCGNSSLGTSVAYPFTNGGAFSINGVPPGKYTLDAIMDNLGQGQPNATNPTNNGTQPTPQVSNANVTGATVALTDPTVTVPSSGPKLSAITPNEGGVVINFKAITSNSEEAVTSYTVQWSTDSTFATGVLSKTFNAVGTHTNVWILNNSVAGSGSFVGGTTYYFRARGVNSAGNSGYTVYGGGTPTGVTILTSSIPSGYNTVTGAVLIPAGITPTGPLYVGFYNQNNNTVFATEIPLASLSTSSPNSYTVYVPTDSSPDYINFAILDQNNDGLIDVGDVTNTNNNGNSSGIAITPTGTLTGYDPALPTANSTLAVTTQYQQDTSYNNGSPNTQVDYSLNFDLRTGNKLPVAVTLTSGPNVINPVDLGACTSCGTAQFQYYVYLNSIVPVVGQTYTFLVTYSDSPTDTQTVSGTVTGWDNTSTLVGLSDLATNLQPSESDSTNLQPTFTWIYPANPGDFIYSFYMNDSNGNTVWQIPSNNSNFNGFTSAQVPMPTGIVWNNDPLSGDNSTPSVGSLTSEDQYTWQIQVQDSNGNSALTTVYYIP
jgi:putative Ig domain-containing protein